MKHRQTTVCVIIGLAILMLPSASDAQRPGKLHNIGYLGISTGDHERGPQNCPITGSPNWQAFLQGLRERGYIPGKNLSIECRWTEDRDDTAPPLAAELVNLKPDLIIASGTVQVRAVKQATSTIPIVMTGVIDPVGRGLVASLSHPGGNVTGLTDTLVEMEGKRLQFLKEAAPGISRVAFLGRKGRVLTWAEQYEAAARTLGLRLQFYLVSGPDELPGAFAAMKQAQEEALLVVPSGTFEMDDTPQRLVEFATRNRLPSTFSHREFVILGGLMSYCIDEPAIRRRVGFYVDKILNGAKPRDLPVEQPAKFKLVINLKTAGALGLTIPPTLLTLADEVIN